MRVDDVGRLQVGGQAQLFAYGGQVLGLFHVSNTEAGTYVVAGDTVPSGKVWEITDVEAHATGGTWSLIRTHVYDGTSAYILNAAVNPAVQQAIIFHGQVPVINPQCVRVVGVSTVSGGDLYLTTIGYKIKVLS